MKLILASTSIYRRQILERIGVPFAIAKPEFDERAPLPAGIEGTEATALYLARGKAEAVRRAHPDAWVIGSDQICELDGVPLHKPGSFTNACSQLAAMQGRTHRLVTAVVVIAPHGSADGVDVHALRMKPLSEAQITAYIAADQPLDCAGSYRIESRGLALFEQITADPECADDTAIVGLPLWKTIRALGALGFDLLDQSGEVGFKHE